MWLCTGWKRIGVVCVYVCDVIIYIYRFPYSTLNKPTEFTRDTYLLLGWYVGQSDSLTVESVVPRPLSLVARSRPLTQPLQSLYPVCMYSGKRHRWGRVMSFGLMPHRIHTNSSNRQTSFALFAFNEATHISRSVLMHVHVGATGYGPTR